MIQTDRDTVGTDEDMVAALHRIEAFLAIVLAERSGPLTSLQRDLLDSARTTAVRAERRLLTTRAAAQAGSSSWRPNPQIPSSTFQRRASKRAMHQ